MPQPRRRAGASGPSLKAECTQLLPEVLKAIEGLASDQGGVDVVKQVRPRPRCLLIFCTHRFGIMCRCAQIVDKVARIEQRLDRINLAHEEATDSTRQQAILTGYVSRVRQQRCARTVLPCAIAA